MTDDANNRYDVSRRTLMKGAGAAGLGSMAGCTDLGLGGDEGTTTLYFAQEKGPLEFDPIVLNDVPSAQISERIFQGLFTYSEGTEIVPELAAGEPEVERDGTRYIVEIKEDAEFQNGDPVTAEDAAYSLTAPVQEETENAAEVDMIDSAEAIDEKTVQFDLGFPYAAFDTTLLFNIVPKSVREEDKTAFNEEEPVGSGPFQFVEYTQEESATIEAWDDYWGEESPEVDEVVWTGIPDGTTRLTSLQNGENDIIETVPPDLYSELENSDEAEIMSSPSIGYYYLAFNCNEGPATDQRVREAVDYCFSMDEAVSNHIEPAGVRQYSPIPAAVAEQWEFPTDEWANVPHEKDIDAAMSLFEEAGVDSDYEWRIIVPPDDLREQLGVSVSNGLQEAGYDASVQRLDWGAFSDQYISGNEDDYNIYALGWSGSPDPEAFTYYLFDQEVEGVTNGTFWQNDEINGENGLIRQARETPDREQRREMYIEAINTTLEERPHLPGYALANSYGVRNYVEGFQSHPDSATIPIAQEYTTVSIGER
ncbi:ABC transporter substrate-binding protein [Natronomonas salina]|uniref:ABC transporter substrate-binding protein n=1 Tax=Natronomonas salina TaxID=1710540 RepID=UPI0015B5DF94|nr:ABC transporter substrate-binding protein [Natronomonas salina]QLD90455.1 ABC transporter substrate-binding protein [Natronomonas salina]